MGAEAGELNARIHRLSGRRRAAARPRSPRTQTSLPNPEAAPDAKSRTVALGLQKLLTKAGRADEKQRLNAPLATIRAVVAAVLAQL